jgi:hypothetical protein
VLEARKLLALNLKIMVLVYLGATVDVKLEQELKSFTENGFKVVIDYDTTIPGKGIQIEQQVFRNATEIHHLFNRSEKSSFDNSVDEIAFESDIRADGFTRKIEGIKMVTITLE